MVLCPWNYKVRWEEKSAKIEKMTKKAWKSGQGLETTKGCSQFEFVGFICIFRLIIFIFETNTCETTVGYDPKSPTFCLPELEWKRQLASFVPQCETNKERDPKNKTDHQLFNFSKNTHTAVLHHFVVKDKRRSLNKTLYGLCVLIQ